MKILITGHKGFIGSNALTYFQDRHEVITYEWDDGPRPSVIDLDWVMHFGAISSTTERDIDKILKQNYDFSIDLFNECKTFGVGFQYSSSASVYGLVSSFREDAALDPKNPYAWSKYLFERYAQKHQGGNIVQGFRYFNVYGPGEDHKGSQASPYHQFRVQAETTGRIKIFEDSHRYLRDFVPVSKVLEVHERMLSKPVSGIFNIGTGRTESFQDVAEEMAVKYNASIEYIPMPDILKGNYQEYTCADMTLLNGILNDNSNS
jgi:ADP-L-glycero-D-manno-heptose 6-epimerase